jgi:hypothetical protein
MGFNNANHTEGPIGSFSSISNGQIIDCPGGSPKVQKYLKKGSLEIFL